MVIDATIVIWFTVKSTQEYESCNEALELRDGQEKVQQNMHDVPQSVDEDNKQFF